MTASQAEAAVHRRPDGSIAALAGAMPATLEAVVPGLISDRVAARKTPEGILAAVPAGDAGHVIWLHPDVPDGQTITQHLRALQARSPGLLQNHTAGADADAPGPDQPQAAAPSAEAALMAAVAAGAVMPRRKRLAAIMAEVAASGVLALAAVVPIRRGKIRAPHMSSRRDQGAADDIRALIAGLRATEQTSLDQSAGTALGLDAELLAERLGAAQIGAFLPPEDGFAVVIADLPPRAAAAAALLPGMLGLALGQGPAPKGTARPRAALALLLLGAGVFLALPAPVTVSATGVAAPATARAISLPADATLKQLFVDPGQDLAKGAAIAEFTSAELDATRDRHEIEISFEETSAQDALARGDVTEYQLAGQRAEIARTKLAQVSAELERLYLTAPEAGRVIALLPDPVPGRFLGKGTEIAQLQDAARFVMRAKLADSDARMITEGQRASLAFRGISATDFQASVASAPIRRSDPETGQSTLMVTLDVADADQSALMVGLSGFARIDTGTAPRIVGLTRSMRDYLRTTAWTWFGLRI